MPRFTMTSEPSSSTLLKSLKLALHSGSHYGLTLPGFALKVSSSIELTVHFICPTASSRQILGVFEFLELGILPGEVRAGSEVKGVSEKAAIRPSGQARRL